jgi:hypothetical protein
MSVRPITHNADGSIEAVYDELGHSGTIPAADIKWTVGIDGTQSHNFIVLECPDGCGGSSTHPVSGGADAPNVQEMFVRKVDADGCVCGTPLARTTQAAIDHVHELVTAMDGEERWQLDDAALLEALSSA